MKVGLIVPGFSAHEQDWCIPVLLEFVRTMASQAQVHVFALRWPERRVTYPVFGATVHALGGHCYPGLRAVGLWRRAMMAIRVEHRRAPFGVLHAFWADEPGWVAAWAGRQLGIPVIISLAGGELVGLRDIGYGAQLLPGRGALIRWGMRQAASVTAGSKYLIDIARRHLPRRRWPRLSYAPLGVDTARFSPGAARAAARGADAPVAFVNVGSLHPVKGQAMLLRALARAGTPHARLTIVGEGPLRAALETSASRLGLSGQVEFAGQIDHSAMPALYRRADIYVQASLHEAQGLATLEAAACGLPVVGTAVGALPEVGRAVVAGDEAALALALREAAASPMGEGRGKVAAEFSLAAAAARFGALYQAIAVG